MKTINFASLIDICLPIPILAPNLQWVCITDLHSKTIFGPFLSLIFEFSKLNIHCWTYGPELLFYILLLFKLNVHWPEKSSYHLKLWTKGAIMLKLWQCFDAFAWAVFHFVKYGSALEKLQLQLQFHQKAKLTIYIEAAFQEKAWLKNNQDY